MIQVSTFKATCLKLIDEVSKKKNSVIITKRGEPVAKLVPIKKKKASLFGIMKGTMHIVGDIIEPVGEEWDANS